MHTSPDQHLRPTKPVACGVALALMLASACAGDSSAESGPASTATGADDHADDTSSDAALDLADDGQGARCTKVDLLFVIDDSHSMASEQGALVASFPEFIAGVRAVLDQGTSYHVAVATTDAYAFNASDCRELGALVTRTGGASSSDSTCGPFDGDGSDGEDVRRFMTESDELEAAFACAAQVGVDGSTDERPIEATLEALGATHEHGCNDGFRRPDALLVVVVITDEEDDHDMLLDEVHGSPGEPGDWFAAVEALVGVESNAAILMIIGGHPDNVCGLPAGVGAQDAPRLREFTEMFTHGFLGDVCAGNYGPFFDEAIGVVDRACAGFVHIP